MIRTKRRAALAVLTLVCFNAAAGPVPMLIDGTGKEIGPVISPAEVLLTGAGTVVRVHVTGEGFDFTTAFRLYHDDGSCTGQPYLEAVGLPPPARFEVSGAASLFVYTPGMPGKVMATGFQRSSTDPPSTCAPLAGPITVAPAVRTQLVLPVIAPLVVQLR